MTATVTLPTWLFVLILLFAVVTASTHLLFPSVRWFFRRRAERAVAELNKRLQRPIQPFKLLRRQDMIQRVIYDPEVVRAVGAHAEAEGQREDVSFEQARHYAREIVPSFSATAYFTVAIRLSRWFANKLFHVRLHRVDAEALNSIDHDATVIYVMNHRSNFDYVLVTYLAGEHTALSYAVGEWARIWPLSRLIRAMGAYFIRRRSRNELYRKVLATYVARATEAGVTQAVFPEGGLSRTGQVGPPKLGILSYVVDAWKANPGRDVVFVPVAINYDRVVEDRILIQAGRTGQRRFRATIPEGALFTLRYVVRRVSGQADRFGTAAVTFGEPVSLGALAAEGDARLVERLALRVANEIKAVMPVPPLPLAFAALAARGGAATAADVAMTMAEMRKRLDPQTAFALPETIGAGDVEKLFGVPVLRRILEKTGDSYSIEDEDLVAFYTASLSSNDSIAAPEDAIEDELEET